MSGPDPLAALRAVALQDSFVEQFRMTRGQLEFSLDTCLQPDHPLYRTPMSGEAACYVKATLVFPNLTRLVFSDSGHPEITGALGESDHGSIDQLHHGPQGFIIRGDFGVFEVASDPPILQPIA
jgi:hypothetical protein